MSEKLIFIVALTEHKYLGHLFTPYLVEKYPTRYYVHTSLLSRDLTSVDFQFSDKEKEIVRLAAKCTKTSLAAKFSRGAPVSDFFVSLNASDLLKNVIPYVQKQMYRIGLILMERKIHFFEKDSSYSNIYEEDAIAIFGEFARIIFSFSCGEEGTDYTVKLFQGNKEIRLFGRTVKFISVNPCILVINNQLHIFSDVDTRKIQPFIGRETIRIAKQIELKYYRNFVTNIIRDHHVEATGFTIVEKNDKPVAVLCLEPDLKYTPVFVLRFRYGENEFLQNDSRRVTVSLEADGRNYTFYKTSRIFSAESEYTDFLAEKGLREVSGAYTFSNLSLVNNDEAVHYLVSWLSSNGKELADRGFEIQQGALDKRYFTGSQDVTFEIRGKGDWFDVYAVVKIGDFHFPFIKLRKYLLHGIREFELPNGEIAVLPDEWFERYKQVAEFARGEGNILNFQRHHYNFVRFAVMYIRPEIATHLEQVFDKTCNIVPPTDLKAKLRKYQVTGYRWLYNLHRNKLGVPGR